ncbi:MAG: 3-dehydroquinate synthase II [Nitrososphaeraceae archaeon]|jgi:3-dehydroquinate synthase II
MYESTQADYVVFRELEQLKKFHDPKRVKGFYKKIESNTDLDEILKAAEAGANFIIVDTQDWRIIPLENVIATLQKTNTRIYAPASSSKEIRTLFSVLELGVDGVILTTQNPNDIEDATKMLDPSNLNISMLKIQEIREAGIGERVCIDTASILGMGEGVLVGSRSNFLFLIHNESQGSSFTSPRPFRVNAGAVYCYTLVPGKKTKYLSEIESGSEVLVIGKGGRVRTVTVGRSKIETRPLTMIVGESNGQRGTVILQNAETIQLIGKDGSLIPVTDLKVGDSVLGVVQPSSGRHFGMEVSEYVLEK